MATRQSTKVQRTCETCSKVFYIFPSRLLESERTGKGKFCSRLCHDTAGYRPTVSPEDRFWSKAAPPNERGCRLWLSVLNNKGYGIFGWRKDARPFRMMLAHRVAWEMTHGPITQGRCVLHSCDTPRCVAPEHLFLGTQADNVADMATKGRGAIGQKARHVKLTASQVLEIRRLHGEEGLSHRQIGDRFGVDASNVSHIVHRHTWKHV